ncbi:multiple sugar transport system substrate-binding protein [Sinosporangium album]|uniref:Multiple sugar transport system substrate-binding protein n=1 Tax=Sinosporangium album TaxID=504805 RepID=A0A1G7QSX7_9ACTN|nr:extracellular solute-binding protein [Sinosporangium album]SDG01617.1 multiple sugar transport system substrate-binding protein [Sinosporangium album]
MGRSSTDRKISLTAAALTAALTAVLILIYQLHFVDDDVQRTTECTGFSSNRLTIGTGADISTGSYRRELIEEWNRTREPDAQLVEIAAVTDEERAEMVSRFQSGACPFDVLILDVAWIPEFARNGYIVELPRRRKSDVGRPTGPAPPAVLSAPMTDPEDLPVWDSARFVPQAHETGMVDGRYYAVPFAADVPLLYHRKSIEIPRTMDQLRHYARGGRFIGQLHDYEGGSVTIMDLLLGEGVRITDARGNVVLRADGNGEKLRKVLHAWSDTENKALSDDAFGYVEETSREEFANGFEGRNGVRFDYMRQWPYAYHRLAMDPRMYARGFDPRDTDHTGRDLFENLDFDVALMPGAGARGVRGGYNLAVSSHTPDPERAYELIDFLTSERSQRELFACGGYSPVLTSVYDDYRYLRAEARSCEHLNPRGRSDDPPKVGVEMLQRVAARTHEALEQSVRRPTSSFYAAFSKVLRTCTRLVLTRRLSPARLDLGRFGNALRQVQRGKVPEGGIDSGDYCRKR